MPSPFLQLHENMGKMIPLTALDAAPCREVAASIFSKHLKYIKPDISVARGLDKLK